MPAPNSPAICHICGNNKDLALARCAQCGNVPSGTERELAMLCSTAVLDPEALGEVQERLRRGEPLRPSEGLRARARAILRGAPPPGPAWTRAQLTTLFFANVLLTPLLGYAAWYRLRTRGGPAARQVLGVSVVSSLVVTAGWVVWRLG